MITKHHKHHFHTCKCTFIPPQVLDNMARMGVKNSIATIQASKIKREKRGTRVNDAVEFFSASSGEDGNRIVYDCKEQWTQRVTEVLREGGSVPQDESVRNAYEFAGIVRDYFKNSLNRDSIDNASMDIILNVHYGKDYQNAFWDGDEMTFGDGDGQIFTDFSRSLDVVAHELTHGVTQWEANLVYDGMSGALNEHFSDVFGTVITQQALGQTADDADWLIGDEIMGPELRGEALRSMIEPGTAYDNDLMGKDPQPAHMNDYYKGRNDNHGVHINSGIMNKVFYLAAKEYEIGTQKAALIWYDALQNLWPNAQFNDAAQVLVNSARKLVLSGKVPKGSPQKIRSALKKVGLPK